CVGLGGGKTAGDIPQGHVRDRRVQDLHERGHDDHAGDDPVVDRRPADRGGAYCDATHGPPSSNDSSFALDDFVLACCKTINQLTAWGWWGLRSPAAAGPPPRVAPSAAPCSTRTA